MIIITTNSNHKNKNKWIIKMFNNVLNQHLCLKELIILTVIKQMKNLWCDELWTLWCNLFREHKCGDVYRDKHPQRLLF